LNPQTFTGILSWVQSWLSDWKKNIAVGVFDSSGHEPYYDFYLTRDEFPTDKLDDNAIVSNYARDYSGLIFNREIATTLKALQSSTDTNVTATMKTDAKIDGILLNEDPKSAFAYCYHKNKRNSDGTIDIANIKWFLPSIDEIEEIALGAYEEFDKTFQNEKYWSCQPAFEYKTLGIVLYQWSDGIFGIGAGYNSILSALSGGELTGGFYSDNIYRARATSVYKKDATNYSTIESGIPSGASAGKLSVKAYDGGDKDGISEPSFNSTSIDYNDAIYSDSDGEYRGNRARTDICRIRAVYRSGTAAN
jgi:hypothetical protein